MPRLISAEIVYGVDPEVRVSTTLPILTFADTAVIRLTETSGSELAIRVERGRVMDVCLWDARAAIDQRLLVDDVVIEGCDISFVMPHILIPAVGINPRVTAMLQLNGTPVQTMPVSLVSGRGERRALTAA